MRNLRPFGAEGEAHRIGGIVRNGERRHRDVGDLKRPSGRKNLQLRNFGQLAGIVAQRPRPTLVRGSGHEHRHLQLFRQRRQSGNMVGMFVGNKNCGKRVRIDCERLQAFESLAAGNSRIHQQSSLAAFNHRGISPAAAGQHRDRNAHTRSIHSPTVELGVTLWLSGTFGPIVPEPAPPAGKLDVLAPTRYFTFVSCE